MMHLFAYDYSGRLARFASCTLWRRTLLADCPDKSSQFACHCGYCLRARLPACNQPPEPVVQPLLSLPCDRRFLGRDSHFAAAVLCSSAAASDSAMTIPPTRDARGHYRFRVWALPASLPGRVLRRHQPDVAHKIGRLGEPSEVPPPLLVSRPSRTRRHEITACSDFTSPKLFQPSVTSLRRAVNCSHRKVVAWTVANASARTCRRAGSANSCLAIQAR